jgi:hypothetical protein
MVRDKWTNTTLISLSFIGLFFITLVVYIGAREAEKEFAKKSIKVEEIGEVKLERPERTQEEKEWFAHEEGYVEGFEDGVNDFEEVERRKAQLRRKGIPVWEPDKKLIMTIRKGQDFEPKEDG